MTRVGLAGGWVLLCFGCGAGIGAPADEPSEESRVAVGLRLTEATEDGVVPRTRVVLVVIDPLGGRATAPAGVFDGACTHDEPMPGTLVTVRCWWAESEAMVSVKRDEDRVVASARESDAYDARPVASLPVEPGADVVAIGAASAESTGSLTN